MLITKPSFKTKCVKIKMLKYYMLIILTFVSSLIVDAVSFRDGRGATHGEVTLGLVNFAWGIPNFHFCVVVQTLPVHPEVLTTHHRTLSRGHGGHFESVLDILPIKTIMLLFYQKFKGLLVTYL